jgi:AcrR family transcriptional regulator
MRLGRPPASSAARTRVRILTVAREAFAELGYGVTTNREIAARAGITTGALYHYFDSKLEIYRAVYEHVQQLIAARFSAARGSGDTFVAQFEAILEAAHELNAHDPSLARFMSSARVDISRHDELRAALGPPSEGRGFSVELADLAIATGEIDAAQRDDLLALLRIVFVGLVDGVSDSLVEHRHGIDAVLSLMRGHLVHAARAARTRKRPA